MAFVTGAGSGIGAATARLLAQRGATVVAADIDRGSVEDVAQGIGASGGSCVGVELDVTDPVSVDRAVGHAGEAKGTVDVVAHCAGVVQVGSILETPVEEYERVIAVNLGGTFNVCRAAIARMRDTGGGSIVVMGSMASLKGFASFGAYCASKGGVLLLVKSLALEWASSGIRVNAVCPGVIRTAMQKDILGAIYDRRPVDEREFDDLLQPQASSFQAIERAGTPEEVAEAVLYLASDAATFVTGTALSIDGGATAG
ncbi:MAG: SDR family NAD(P)-dependent oxidoreductase [Solirubrobacterales bacterium]